MEEERGRKGQGGGERGRRGAEYGDKMPRTVNSQPLVIATNNNQFNRNSFEGFNQLLPSISKTHLHDLLTTKKS